jgi:adenylate kinase
MRLIFLGPPGVGKGTQAAMVSAAHGIPHISTGEMLRNAIRDKSPMGLAAKAYIDRGDLVPDSTVIDMLNERINRPGCAKGFLLDGFPRTLAQARSLGAITAIDAVLEFMMPYDFLIGRITGRRVCSGCGETHHVELLDSVNTCPDCGAALKVREDDNEESIAHRLDVYYAETSPLIAFYTEAGVLRRVDAARPSAIVAVDIAKLLAQFT